jgi:hypothetical protein
MPKSTLILVILFIVTAFRLHAQTIIKGSIQDANDKSPLVGAAIQLISQRDTLQRKITTADVNGDFSFKNLKKDTYIIRAIYTGYERFRMKVTANEGVKDIGIIKMKPSAFGLKEVEIHAHVPRMQQKGDTLQYNADAFKTNPDADAEELLAKMPGISIDNGTVKANGEEIQQILLDGKPYFGGDLNAALKNIPAETIDKILVYYKLSDQSVFTGIDDGQGIKVINIITKADKRNGWFGKTLADYGTSNRYTADENVNYFDGNRRITLSGGTTNANNGNQGGINTTNRAGLNYADSLGKKIYLSGSYALNNTLNSTESELTRNYFGALNNTEYQENSTGHSASTSHNLNLRLESMMDSANTLTFSPSAQWRNSHSNSSRYAENRMANLLQSNEQNLNMDRNNNYTINSSLMFGHRFHKKGRTLSMNVNTGMTRNTSLDTLRAGTTNYSAGGDSTTITDQRSNLLASSYDIAPVIAYTEQLSSNSHIQLQSRIDYNNSSSDKNTYNFDPASGEYIHLDTSLSNKYKLQTFTSTTGVIYRISQKKYNVNAGLNYQDVQLKGAFAYPLTFDVEKRYVNILPGLVFNYKFTKKNNLNINYQTSTTLPNIYQLQSTINNSNPLLLNTGNPGLLQQYTHTLSARIGIPAGKTNNIYVYLSSSKIMHVVGTAVSIATRDSLLPQGYLMQKGAQLSRPVNLEGAYNIHSNATYSLPLDKFKSNLNFSTGFNYNSLPGLVNNVLNFANTYNFNSAITLSSNSGKNFDYTISSSPGYNIVKNTLVPQQNNNYYSQMNTLRVKWIIWKGIVINTDASYRIYTGLNSSYQQHLLIWNASLGEKLFRKQNGEIRLYVYDLLNQNQSLSRTVTDTYVQDRQANVLGRIFMISFVYHLRDYKAASK